MKRLLLFIVIAAAAPVVWGQPGQRLTTNDIAQKIDAAFDRSRLKSIMLKYEKKFNADGIEENREIFLVLDGKKFFIRTHALGPWENIDYTVDPPRVTTNWSPNVSYLWCTGEHVVEGTTISNVPWNIYPSATWDYYSEEALSDLRFILYLEDPSTFSIYRFRGERPSPGGRTYLFTSPATGIDVEYTVSDADGDGLAPVRQKDLREGNVLSDITWSGWKNYNGIWVPKHCIRHYLGFSDSDMRTGGTASIEEYKLINVEKVNEPIHARWFMPQFPAGPITIEDRTVSPPLEMDNINLDGIPYTDVEEYEEEEESGVVDEQDE